ncbi:uncharacterized protein V1516DRAFT_611792, partial [Lipomyces oligophaga]|uniref:uncharacterized protein n=1 Tax=Lipomyces oligophaga TaxID=45792 RepID=UPI0034CDEFA2
RVCSRCKILKAESTFAKPSGREGLYKFCAACRELSRQHTSETRKRKRENQNLITLMSDSMNGKHSNDLSGGPNMPTIEISSFEEFKNMFPSPARDDPAYAAAAAEGKIPIIHQCSFQLHKSVSLDGGITTIDDMLSSVNGEPVEVFKRIVQAIFEVSGFYFARRARTRSPRSYRIQYVCSQVADTSNNRHPGKVPKRARSRRDLYDCHGRLILAALYQDHSVLVKYTHHIVHGPATRRRYLPEIVKQYIKENRSKPLTDICSGIRSIHVSPEMDVLKTLPHVDLNSITRKQVYIYLKRLHESEMGGRPLRDDDDDDESGPDDIDSELVRA